jgi:1-deoxy-D-xylulose-5-phosphate synthase
MDLNIDVNENKKYIYLDRVNSPDDLKAMDQKDLDGLASDIRTFLVDKVSENGGHLASNLGVVELTLALHRVFSTPKDHIIFDVGHQSYVHKVLTGRKDEFDTLRCSGGLCGFESRRESEHDCFGTGHSSTSISAALGFATADKLRGSDAYTVAVVGDGAFTGGMIHEALNNCENDLKLIIVINENEMSISKNTGRFARTLSFLRMKKGYVSTKSATKKILSHIPIIGKLILSLLRGIIPQESSTNEN